MKKVGGTSRTQLVNAKTRAEALDILYEDIMYIINEYEKCQQSLTNKQNSLTNIQQIINEEENKLSTRLGTLNLKIEQIKKELQQPTLGGKTKSKSKSKTKKKKKNYKKKTRNKRKTKNKRKGNKRRKTYKKKK